MITTPIDLNRNFKLGVSSRRKAEFGLSLAHVEH